MTLSTEMKLRILLMRIESRCDNFRPDYPAGNAENWPR